MQNSHISFKRVNPSQLTKYDAVSKDDATPAADTNASGVQSIDQQSRARPTPLSPTYKKSQKLTLLKINMGEEQYEEIRRRSPVGMHENPAFEVRPSLRDMNQLFFNMHGSQTTELSSFG